MRTEHSQTAPAEAQSPSRSAGKTETRRRLLEAAAEVIARKGLHAASLMEIAREAGVTTGAIYSSFKDKEELLFAVVDELTPTLVHGDLVSSEMTTSVSSVQDLARLAGHYADDPQARRLLQLQLEVFSLSLREPQVLETLAREARASIEGVAELVQKEVARDKPGPAPPTPSPQEAATVLISAIQGLMQHRVLGSERLPDEVFEWMAYAIVSALRTPSDPRKG